MNDTDAEFDASVTAVVDEMVTQSGAEQTLERLRSRRRTDNDELRARATEGLAYLKREVLDDA